MKSRLLRWFPAASSLLAYRPGGEMVAQAPFTEAGFSICVHAWSFRKFPLFEAMEMAAAAGAGGIELYPGQMLGGRFPDVALDPGMPNDALDAVVARLAGLRLAAHNLGVIPVPDDETRARRIFEFAKRLGLLGITTESLGSIDVLEGMAAETGITVGFHNHPKPTALWHPETISNAVEGRHANLGFCADTGHWASSGLDPLEVVREIAPRIRSFHLKDRPSVTEWSRDQPLGTGIIRIPEILSEVLRHGFTGNVSIEHEANWSTSLPEIAQGVGYLRAWSQVRPSGRPSSGNDAGISV